MFFQNQNKNKDKNNDAPAGKAEGPHYAVGIDLRDDVCQISYGVIPEQSGGEQLQEPVTWSAVPGEDRFDIPTVLCRKRGENLWFYGTEAVQKSADPEMIFLPHLLQQALDGTPVSIDDEEYDPEALLALFLSRCLAAVSGVVPKDAVRAVLFACRKMDSRTIEVLDDVRSRLDLDCSVWYESFAGAFYDFMLNQTQELREPGTILFEYEEGGKLRVCRLLFNLHTTPVVAYREEKEYPGLFAEDDAGRDVEFLRIAGEEMRGKVFSSVYLIGSGFKGGWMKKSAAWLCRGRRVFLGNNLYSKGAACGAILRETKAPVLGRYYFLDSNKLRSNIMIEVLDHGQRKEETLLEAGVNWYEVHQTADLILDGTGELNLVLRPLTGGEPEPFHIRLDRLPVREGRITRIRMTFTMRSADKVRILIEDLGFGEIFPSSGLRWEQVITV